MHGHEQELALVLGAHPELEWFVRHKCLSLSPWLDELQTRYSAIPTPTGNDLHQVEQALIGSMEDWIIYVTEPEVYDRLSCNRWDDRGSCSA
jgi:hypothetical protein